MDFIKYMESGAIKVVEEILTPFDKVSRHRDV